MDYGYEEFKKNKQKLKGHGAIWVSIDSCCWLFLLSGNSRFLPLQNQPLKKKRKKISDTSVCIPVTISNTAWPVGSGVVPCDELTQQSIRGIDYWVLIWYVWSRQSYLHAFKSTQSERHGYIKRNRGPQALQDGRTKQSDNNIFVFITFITLGAGSRQSTVFIFLLQKLNDVTERNLLMTREWLHAAWVRDH